MLKKIACRRTIYNGFMNKSNLSIKYLDRGDNNMVLPMFHQVCYETAKNSLLKDSYYFYLYSLIIMCKVKNHEKNPSLKEK